MTTKLYTSEEINAVFNANINKGARSSERGFHAQMRCGHSRLKEHSESSIAQFAPAVIARGFDGISIAKRFARGAIRSGSRRSWEGSWWVLFSMLQ